MDKITIGNKIKYERESLALTQLELSKLIGVTKQCISGWETGRTTPDSITLNKIAKIFNVDLTYFLNEEKPQHLQERKIKFDSLTDKEVQIISKLRAMSAEKRKAIELLFGVS